MVTTMLKTTGVEKKGRRNMPFNGVSEGSLGSGTPEKSFFWVKSKIERREGMR